MKAKFISKYSHREYNNLIIELEYEYRGYRYIITENKTKGNEPLSWQHKNEQARIDHIIEMENKKENLESQSSSIDEAINKLFEEWEQ